MATPQTPTPTPQTPMYAPSRPHTGAVVANTNQPIVGSGPTAIAHEQLDQMAAERRAKIEANRLDQMQSAAPEISQAWEKTAFESWQKEHGGQGVDKTPWWVSVFSGTEYKPTSWQRGSYIDDPGAGQANAAISLAHALGNDSTLIRHPQLLLAAAHNDMQASDMKYMATMSDIAYAYRSLMGNEDSWQNVSDRYLKRMDQSQALPPLYRKAISVAGDGLLAMGDLVHYGVTKGEQALAYATGESATPLKPDETGQQDYAFTGDNPVFDTVRDMVATAWAPIESVTNIQHSFRWLHHIEATQGKAAAAEAAGAIVAYSIILSKAVKGLGLGMKAMETAGLRKSAGEILGKDVAKFLDAPELRVMAYAANDEARHMAFVRRAHTLLLNQPEATRGSIIKRLANFGSRHGAKDVTDPFESELLAATGKYGNNFDRFSAGVGKGLKGAANKTNSVFNYSWNHYRFPINVQTAAYLAANTDGAGFAKGWKDAWDATKDGHNYRDPNTNRPVSLGRDLASSLKLRQDTFTFDAVSGISDLLTMFNFDASIGVMKALPIGRSLPALTSKTDVYRMYESNPDFRKMADYVATHSREAREKFRAALAKEEKQYFDQIYRRHIASGKKPSEARQKVNLLKASGQMKQISKMLEGRVFAKYGAEVSSASRIVRVFPQFANTITPEAGHQAMNLIHLLSRAETPEEVVNVLGKAVEAHALANPNRMPSYGRFTEYKDKKYLENLEAQETRSRYGKQEQITKDTTFKSTTRQSNRFEPGNTREGKNVTRKFPGTEGKLARGAVSLKPTYFDALMNFSNKEIKVGDPRSLDLGRRMFLAMGIDPHVVDWTINRLANTANAREWKVVFENSIRDTFHVHSEAVLQDLVRVGELGRTDALELRNVLEKEFAPLMDEYANSWGGGGAAGNYSGADISQVVDRRNPFQRSSQYPTAGLLESHEHLITLPDYKAVDDYIRYVAKGLASNRSKSLKNVVLDKAAEAIGRPFEVQRLQIARRQNLIMDEITTLDKKIADDTAAGIKRNPDDFDHLATLKKYFDDLGVQAKSLLDQKLEEVEKKIGKYEFFDAPEKRMINTSEALHSVHDFTRKWLIDKYFRPMALATIGFATRVSSSETIATMFRLGGKEFGKALLSHHVAKGIEAARNDAKQTVGEEIGGSVEHGFIMQRVHETLQALNDVEHEFMKGVARGGGLGKMVERMAQDAKETGGGLSGLSSQHVDGRITGMGTELVKGNNNGSWLPSSDLGDDTMRALSTQLYDVANSPVGRKSAQILYKFLSPQQHAGMSLGWRLKEAEDNITSTLAQLMKSDPKTYDNFIRKATINRDTLERIEKEVLSTPGITDINSVAARQLMTRKLRDVDSIREWAHSLMTHILWLSHGRGASNARFTLENMTESRFHRHVLQRLANNRLPKTAEGIQELYLRPTLEQARIEAHRELNVRATAGAKFPGKMKSHHEVLLHSDKDFSDLKTLTPEEHTHFGLPAYRVGPRFAPDYKDEALQDLSDREISDMIRAKYTPEKYKATTRIAKSTITKRSIAEQYKNSAGETSVHFPNYIPTPTNITKGVSGFMDTVVDATVGRASNAIHDRFSQPIIDTLSRQPLYTLEYNKALDHLEQWKDLDPAVARNIARQRAVIKAISFVHNPADRYVLEQWSRAYMPFWFAKNQALRRAGRFAIEDPARFQAYVRAMLAMQHFGADTMANLDEQNGMLLPGSAMAGRYVTDVLHALGIAPAGGVPIGLTGSLTSLASVFPWTDPTGTDPGGASSIFHSLKPDFGPAVAFPLRQLAMRFPHQKWIEKMNEQLLGHIGANASTFQMLVPNSGIRAATSLAAFKLGGRNSVTMQLHAIQVSLMMDAIAQENRRRYLVAEKYMQNYFDTAHPEYKTEEPVRYANSVRENARHLVETGIIENGKVILTPIKEMWDNKSMEEMLNDSKNGALALYAARSVLSFMSPLSLQLTSARPKLEKLVRDAQIAGLDSGKLAKLYNDNLDAVWFAAHSTASATGLPLQATVDMSRITNANPDLFDQYPSGALAFVPHTKEGEKFDAAEYHNQLNSGARVSQEARSVFKEMRRQEGNWYAYEFLPQFVKDQGGDDPALLSQLKRDYRSQNVIWAKSQGDTKVVRVAAFKEVRAMLDPKTGVKNLADRTGFKETVSLVKQIVNTYDEMHQSWQYAGTGWKQSFEDDWKTYMTDFVKKHPVITSGYISIFRGLKLSDNA
jgi:hypothetical protein